MKAVITGITGQDGSFMAEILLEAGYGVAGLVRRRTHSELGSVAHLESEPDIEFFHGDITDRDSVEKILQDVKPDLIFHFAAQSHVGESFEQPELTMRTNVGGTLNLFRAALGLEGSTKIFNACTSEMFGAGMKSGMIMQDESTPFATRSPYGTSKIAQFNLAIDYRRTGDLRIWNGITFNHESERRPVDFVTRKITAGVARLVNAESPIHIMGSAEPMTASLDGDPIHLGNLDSKRDWGYAPDYCQIFYQILTEELGDSRGDDFVIATGEARSVGEFAQMAFQAVGASEHSWRDHVQVDKAFIRPADINYLCGDTKKLRRAMYEVRRSRRDPNAPLDLTPIHEWIRRMVDHDLKLLGKTLP